MKKVYKIFLGILVIVIASFSIYVYKLHSLALESNRIFEKRCLNVNPPLIAYKNSFLNFTEALKHPDKYNTEQMVGFYQNYIDGMKMYIPKENEWLYEQTDFVYRWDFQMLEPWYIKEAASYQLAMYLGYRDEAMALVSMVDDKFAQDKSMDDFYDARERRNKYTDLYNDIFDRSLPIHDWRKIFASVPVPAGCNDENLIIPDTSGALDPEPPPVNNTDITG